MERECQALRALFDLRPQGLLSLLPRPIRVPALEKKANKGQSWAKLDLSILSSRAKGQGDAAGGLSADERVEEMCLEEG